MKKIKNRNINGRPAKKPSEKMGYKIRMAQTRKIPYMLVIGDKEVQSGQVSVRNRFQGDEGSQSLESFIETIEGFIKNRTARP